MDENEQSAGISGVVPNLISVVPESTLNIFPLPLVCLVFVLGYTVVFFWRMPEETTCSSSVLSQSQTVNSRGEFLHPSHPHRNQVVERPREVVKNQLIPHPQSKPDHLSHDMGMIWEVVT